MNRVCGDCTLCCRLIPVEALGKAAGKRCKSQRATGCAVYATRPLSCRSWSCRWLLGDALPRPDRAAYVVDPSPDYVEGKVLDSEEVRRIPVIQIWVDPRYPDAHRDPMLRAYLLAASAEGLAAIVRYDAARSLALFAPVFTGTGEWREHPANVVDRDPAMMDKVLQRRDLFSLVDRAILAPRKDTLQNVENPDTASNRGDVG